MTTTAGVATCTGWPKADKRNVVTLVLVPVGSSANWGSAFR